MLYNAHATSGFAHCRFVRILIHGESTVTRRFKVHWLAYAWHRPSLQIPPSQRVKKTMVVSPKSRLIRLLLPEAATSRLVKHSCLLWRERECRCAVPETYAAD